MTAFERVYGAEAEMAKSDYKKELDELAASARRARGVESAIVKSYEEGEDAEIHVDIDSESTVHMHRYGDGTWWWQRGYGYEMEDEDETGKPFKDALKDALMVENPRKKKKKSPLKRRVKKAEKKVVRGAKKAGGKVKKFAKTKTGYTAGAAGIGALALGPLGAIAGAIGGSALYDNPGLDLFSGYEAKVETYSDGELKEQFEEHSETLSASKHPVRDFGTEGYPMYVRILAILRAEMSRRGLLVMNPHKKKASKRKPAAKNKPVRRRRKNPSAVDHERVGMDALKQSEKYHRRYMEHNRLNDLLDTYKWLLIGHEELKYSGKAEPRIQARDGLKAVRRLLLERM